MANTVYSADVPTAGTVLPAARTKAVDGGAGMDGGQSFGICVSQKKGTAGPGLGSEHAEQHAFLQPGSHQAICLFVAGFWPYIQERALTLGSCRDGSAQLMTQRRDRASALARERTQKRLDHQTSQRQSFGRQHSL